MKPILVLNTRPREQSAELSRLLEAAGFLAVEVPAIEIIDAWDPVALFEARRIRYDWVVLASANAGRQLDLGGSRVVCGSATATALGLEAEIALDHFSAVDALEALQGQLAPGERVLVPRAAEGRAELVDGLLALGATVDAPIAYRTAPVDDAARRLSRHDIDVVTLCSPSAARAVAAGVSRERIVCLGQTTAEAARSSGLGVAAVAQSTSMEALVLAVRGITRGVTV